MSVFRYLLRLSPGEISIFLGFIGGGICLWSWAIGIHDFVVCWGADGNGLTSCDAEGAEPKQVGFLLAVNWSMTTVGLLPLFTYCAFKVLRSFDDVLRRMADSHMLVDDDLEPASKEALSSVRRHILRRSLVLIVPALTLITTALVIDYERVVSDLYEEKSYTELGQFDRADSTDEVDWSVAGPVCQFAANLDSNDGSFAGYEKCPVRFEDNLVFSTFVYIYAAWLFTALVIAFFTFVILIPQVLRDNTLSQHGLHLIPKFDSPERRRGFEYLSETFENVFAAAFIAFLIGWLMVMQNVFLRTDDVVIVDFFFSDLLLSAQMLGDGYVVAGLVELVWPDKFLNITAAMVMAIGTFIILTLVIAVLGSLRTAATVALDRGVTMIKDSEKRAKLEAAFGSEAIPYIENGKVKRGGEDFEMDFWPLSWPNINHAALFLAIAFACVFFYKIGIFVMAVGIGKLVKRMI